MAEFGQIFYFDFLFLSLIDEFRTKEIILQTVIKINKIENIILLQVFRIPEPMYCNVYTMGEEFNKDVRVLMDEDSEIGVIKDHPQLLSVGL